MARMAPSVVLAATKADSISGICVTSQSLPSCMTRITAPRRMRLFGAAFSDSQERPISRPAPLMAISSPEAVTAVIFCGVACSTMAATMSSLSGWSASSVSMASSASSLRGGMSM